jgi:DNA processing protein
MEIYKITQNSEEFPPLLKEIPQSPKLLYRRGSPLNNQKPHIAIVGTRMPSAYGEKIAYILAKEIIKAGAIVVSGLAFGIDAKVHKAAVDLGKPTVAILASGVKHVTPQSHTDLANKIIEKGGTILSEYENYNSAHKFRFLERNRLISGLCKATIVIEAKERSGALITANHAFDQNRDIFALPGDIDRPQAQGCLKLIAQDKAIPITSKEQLLEDLGLNLKQTQIQSFASNKNDNTVMCLLEEEPHSAQSLTEKTGLPIMKINSTLSMLELQNLIVKLPNQKWKAA